MKSKKSQKTDILKLLPQKITLELNLILQSKVQTSILKRMPHLINAFSSNAKTSSFISQCREELKQKDNEYWKQRAEALAWLKEKIHFLKTSRWSQHPVIKNKIKKAEDAIEAKFYNPLSGSIEHIWLQLKEAAFAVVAFGEESIFYNWARIGIDDIEIRKVDSLSLSSTDNDESKWKFAEIINTGFISYKLSLCQEFFSLKRGYIQEFIFPHCMEVMLVCNRSQEDWEADCESDASTLFNHLQMLAQYPLYKKGVLKPLTLPLANFPKTLDEVDELFINGCIVYYLSCFDARDSRRQPASLKQLKELILNFLIMLGSYMSQDDASLKPERKSRNEARVRDAKIVKEWMINQWKEWSISQSTMVAKLRVAIALGELELELNYKPSSGNTEGTFERWASQADPWPEDIKRTRKKTKNLT